MGQGEQGYNSFSYELLYSSGFVGVFLENSGRHPLASKLKYPKPFYEEKLLSTPQNNEGVH